MARAITRPRTPLTTAAGNRIPVEEEGGVLVVLGHKLTDKQIKGFMAYHESGGDPTEGRKAAGVSPRAFWGWRRAVWWQALEEEFLVAAQSEFRARLAKNAKKLAQGVVDVAAGKDKEDRTANARVSAGRMFAEMGTKPLIQKHSKVSVEGEVRHTHGGATPEAIREAIRGLTAEEMLRWKNFGEKPRRLLELSGEALDAVSEDAEFTEVEG